MKRKQEIEARMTEIRGILAGKEECDIDALEAEVRDLQAEKAELEKREKRAAMAAELQTGAEGRGIEKPAEKPEDLTEAEKRGKALKEKRSVTLDSTGVILPAHQATDIKPTFNEVSSLLDRVNIKPMKGGESFKQPYLAGYGLGGYTTEGENPTEAEPTFAYAQINKTKITAYAEDSEELVKLPAANYDAEVMKGISVAARKKITREILVGDGASGHFVGIFDDAATAIDADTDVYIDEINEETLDEIIFSYGGDEDVEDAAVLVLNKKDLKAFSQIRGTDSKRVHEIKRKGNTGTIDGVPFIINSACGAVSDDDTADETYCMAYGPLSNYTLAIFSDLEVARSTDYKFKEGMIAHRGVIFSGGNVTAKNGFLRVKKGTAAS
jgi:HK97 family phage major capsid protein